MSQPPKLWKMAAQPSWLVDVLVLSGRPDLHSMVLQELNDFRENQLKSVANSLLANYSYVLNELLYPTGIEFSGWIKNLLSDPKLKDLYSIGQTFQAIIDRNEMETNAALEYFLIAQRGKAIFGILRETAEGYLYMPAMSLAYTAYQYGVKVDITNEYFSDGCLDFLISNAMKKPIFRTYQ